MFCGGIDWKGVREMVERESGEWRGWLGDVFEPLVETNSTRLNFSDGLQDTDSFFKKAMHTKYLHIYRHRR